MHRLRNKITEYVENNYFFVMKLIGFIAIALVFIMCFMYRDVKVYIEHWFLGRLYAVFMIVIGGTIMTLHEKCPMDLVMLVDGLSYGSAAGLVGISTISILATDRYEMGTAYIIMFSICLVLSGTAFLAVPDVYNRTKGW